jgi:D-glycero-D-manno-heptose 1,7-bisphosphate phosphatase
MKQKKANNLKVMDRRKAVFLDRDGTLNNNGDHYYIWRVEDFELNPGVEETLRELMQRGYMLFVVTNQGGISKGLYSREETEALHTHLQGMLEEKGLSLEEVLYCPHHPDLENCLCRKPLPLLIQKALARYDIDPAESWMVGDAERDVEAGLAAGLQTIQVPPNGDLRKILDEIN